MRIATGLMLIFLAAIAGLLFTINLREFLRHRRRLHRRAAIVAAIFAGALLVMGAWTFSPNW